MRILVDADSCPVKEQIEAIAQERNIPVILFSDYNHHLSSSYSEIVTVQEGINSADYALLNFCQKGDVIVTKDILLASLGLSKGAKVLNPSGREYRNETIDLDLAVRNMRAVSRHTHKRKKRQSEKKNVTVNFQDSLNSLLC